MCTRVVEWESVEAAGLTSRALRRAGREDPLECDLEVMGDKLQFQGFLDETEFSELKLKRNRTTTRMAS